MCGITGIYAFNASGGSKLNHLSRATEALSSRGPDHQGHFQDAIVGLGHRRLSIIDTSDEANQPMQDASGRYALVFNGEIYNYQNLRQELKSQGVNFRTASDTEVLLQLLILEGEQALPRLNGFFAFAFYDKETSVLLLARDRFGIKPLHYFVDHEKLIFASEVKSLLRYGIKRQLNYTALFTYLQLNYIPGPLSMLEGMQKLLPGHLLRIRDGEVKVEKYYDLSGERQAFAGSYVQAVTKLRDLLEAAVVDRLVADVPLGTFLSGGTDSSIISSLASKHVGNLKTFSIGYRDEAFFDETPFALATAKKLGTDHTVFTLSNNDLFEHLNGVLEYIDEPFADSSALAVHILSKHTKQEVTVALSGDGADELFAGYNKHAALFKIINGGMSSALVKAFGPLWRSLPRSRNNSLANRFRQLDRYARAARLDGPERYWFLAALGSANYAREMIREPSQIDNQAFTGFRSAYLQPLQEEAGINENLQVDQQLVLPNDMLTKVDLMSMAHGLEVRVPFLDQRVVEFANSLPATMKINGPIRKRILQDAFREDLPKELYNRRKQGFEVPLLKWFRTELSSAIATDYLADDFIQDQGIFRVRETGKLKKQLFSSSPGDSPAKIWALVVFQAWYRNYFMAAD